MRDETIGWDQHTRERRERLARRAETQTAIACDTADLYDLLADHANEVGWTEVAASHRATAQRLRLEHHRSA